MRIARTLNVLLLATLAVAGVKTQDGERRRAFVDGTEPGWRVLESNDFAGVNGAPDTWAWSGGVLHSTGKPIGVMRTARMVTNVELLVEWRHLESGGNSGVFVWVPEQALTGLKPGVLPDYGIEIQMLDHGFREKVRERIRTQGRLVHDERRCLCCRQVHVETLFADVAERVAKFSTKGSQQGCRGVESLLRSRDRRRDPALGERRRSLRRERRGAAERVSLSGSGGGAGGVPEHPDPGAAVGVRAMSSEPGADQIGEADHPGRIP